MLLGNRFHLTVVLNVLETTNLIPDAPTILRVDSSQPVSMTTHGASGISNNLKKFCIKKVTAKKFTVSRFRTTGHCPPLEEWIPLAAFGTLEADSASCSWRDT